MKLVYVHSASIALVGRLSGENENSQLVEISHQSRRSLCDKGEL